MVLFLFKSSFQTQARLFFLGNCPIDRVLFPLLFYLFSPPSCIFSCVLIFKSNSWNSQGGMENPTYPYCWREPMILTHFITWTPFQDGYPNNNSSRRSACFLVPCLTSFHMLPRQTEPKVFLHCNVTIQMRNGNL